MCLFHNCKKFYMLFSETEIRTTPNMVTLRWRRSVSHRALWMHSWYEILISVDFTIFGTVNHHCFRHLFILKYSITNSRDCILKAWDVNILLIISMWLQIYAFSSWFYFPAGIVQLQFTTLTLWKKCLGKKEVRVLKKHISCFWFIKSQ